MKGKIIFREKWFYPMREKIFSPENCRKLIFLLAHLAPPLTPSLSLSLSLRSYPLPQKMSQLLWNLRAWPRVWRLALSLFEISSISLLHCWSIHLHAILHHCWRTIAFTHSIAIVGTWTIAIVGTRKEEFFLSSAHCCSSISQKFYLCLLRLLQIYYTHSIVDGFVVPSIVFVFEICSVVLLKFLVFSHLLIVVEGLCMLGMLSALG